MNDYRVYILRVKSLLREGKVIEAYDKLTAILEIMEKERE